MSEDTQPPPCGESFYDISANSLKFQSLFAVYFFVCLSFSLFILDFLNTTLYFIKISLSSNSFPTFFFVFFSISCEVQLRVKFICLETHLFHNSIQSFIDFQINNNNLENYIKQIIFWGFFSRYFINQSHLSFVI